METVKVRIHAFDTLRTVMVLLGLVIHASNFYNSNLFNDLFFVNDPANHSFVFNILTDLIHTFRMPIFYALSGFFTALLFFQRGMSQMIHNRLHRLVYPFVVGMVTILPFYIYAINFYLATAHHDPNRATSAFFAFGNFKWSDLTTAHLWFLYYLILFCAAATIIAYGINRWFPAFSKRSEVCFHKIFRSETAPLIFAIPTLACLFWMQTFDIKAIYSFAINFRFFVTYSIFFLFGWLCYCVRDDMSRFENFSRTYLCWGIGLFLLRWICLYFYRSFEKTSDEKLVMTFVLAVLLSITIWLLLFGIIGFFLKYLNQPSAVARYLADGSYWIYLVHIPIVLILQAILLEYDIASAWKFLIVLITTFLITVVTYNYLVRNTFIGKFLNGHKYPRPF